MTAPNDPNVIGVPAPVPGAMSGVAGTAAAPALAPVPPPPDPAADLDKLKQKLQENLVNSAALADAANELKTQVGDLQKLVDQIGASKAAYEKSMPSLVQQKSDFANYAKTKQAMLEATVQNKQAVVLAKQAGDQNVAHLQDQADGLKVQIANDAKAYAAAQAQTLQAQDQYDSALTLLSKYDAWAKDLAALRAAAEKRQASNDLQAAYFLILEMEDVLKMMDPPTPASYLQQLNAASTKLSDAKNAERAAKETVDKDTATLQQGLKDVAVAVANRRDTILKSISEKAAQAPS